MTKRAIIVGFGAIIGARIAIRLSRNMRAHCREMASHFKQMAGEFRDRQPAATA